MDWLFALAAVAIGGVGGAYLLFPARMWQCTDRDDDEVLDSAALRRMRVIGAFSLGLALCLLYVILSDAPPGEFSGV